MNRRKFQLVNWFPQWIGMGFTRLNPNKTDMAFIYEWYLWLGWFEIRKWAKQEDV